MEQCEVRGAADPTRGAGDAEREGAAGVRQHDGNMVSHLCISTAGVQRGVPLGITIRECQKCNTLFKMIALVKIDKSTTFCVLPRCDFCGIRKYYFLCYTSQLICF